MAVCTMKDNIGLGLTIYNDGFALVSEHRSLGLSRQETRLEYMDVAQLMEVNSLRIDGADAAEVDYEYDLVDRLKLLSKYVGEMVYLRTKDGVKLECQLLSTGSELILKDSRSGEILIAPAGELVLPQLPEGLLARPSLVFKLRPQAAQKIGVSYLTGGLSWETNYVAELKGDTFGLDVWVEIKNTSGITFTDTRLKLLAGKVNRASRQRSGWDSEELILCANEMSPPSFTEKGFAYQHLYTMQGLTTLKNNQSKQLRLFGCDCAPYRRYYEVPPDGEDVQIAFEFANRSEDNLGIPLPAGIFKLYQRDETDSTLTFVGEDRIGHTPKGETIRLYLGEAFDLRCNKKCLAKGKTNGIKTEQWQFTLKSHKEEPALFRVKHRLSPTAVVTGASHQWIRPDASEISFEVEVKPGAEEIIDFSLADDQRVHVFIDHRQ